MMNFIYRDGHILVNDVPNGVSRTAISNEFQRFLAMRGMDQWSAEDAIRNMHIEKVWWSNIYGGLTHNCEEHVQSGVPRNADFCYPDAKEEIVILDAPLPAIEAVRGAMSGAS